MSGDAGELVEHFFRHESGRLVATLVRRVGLQHLEHVEDSVQAALATALTAWTAHGTPREPSAWLFQVALRNVLATLRANRRHGELEASASVESKSPEPTATFEAEVSDELLRMMFVCCAETIPPESRLVFTLKTLCGFSTGEVAARLFTSEANVHKRLQRARDALRQLPTELDSLESLRARLPSVQGVLYVLFNEGHLSVSAPRGIRAELCDEAIRLTSLLAAHPCGAEPSTFALLALMHLHAARLNARGGEPGLLLLEEQDRSTWDVAHLQQGALWLSKAGQGSVLTRFHVEAGIAAEHCFAPSFVETNWRAVAALYEVLERIDPSPLHTANRAVAVAQVDGPAAGLSLLSAVEPPPTVERHFMWNAVLADLCSRAGEVERARLHRAKALEAAPSEAIRATLERRLGAPSSTA